MAHRPHLFFDLDGTLLDSQDGITRSLQKCLLAMGRPVPPQKDLLWAIGVPLDEVCARMLGTKDPHELKKAVDLYRESYWGGEMEKAFLYPGVPEMLEALSRAGKKMYLATHKLESMAGIVLDKFGIRKHFLGIYGFNDQGHQSKALYLGRGLKAHGIDPGTAVMIGDRQQDIEAAKICGTAAIAVTYGYGSREELEKAGAEVFCAKPADLASPSLLLPPLGGGGY